MCICTCVCLYIIQTLNVDQTTPTNIFGKSEKEKSNSTANQKSSVNRGQARKARSQTDSHQVNNIIF